MFLHFSAMFADAFPQHVSLEAAIWELAAVGCLTTPQEVPRRSPQFLTAAGFCLAQDAEITPLGQIAIAGASDMGLGPT